jgi:hypothetical protein
MTAALESANEHVRQAVQQRREAQAAGKPSEEWYSGCSERDPVQYFLQQESRCEGQRLRGDCLLREERPLGSVEWLEVLEQLRQLHFEKTAQYGDSDPFANVTASAKCGVEPWRRALCDLSDCVVRMQRFANGQPVDYENALMDAANWALICLVKLREAKA